MSGTIKHTHTLGYTLAARNPDGLQQVLIDNGYGHRVNLNERNLTELCCEFIIAHGEKALKQLANIHPDKDLIISFAIK